MTTAAIKSDLPLAAFIFLVGAFLGALADRVYLTSRGDSLLPSRADANSGEAVEAQKHQWQERLFGKWLEELKDNKEDEYGRPFTGSTRDFRNNGIVYIGSWIHAIDGPLETDWEKYSLGQWAWIDDSSIGIRQYDEEKYYTVAFDDDYADRLILIQYGDSRPRAPNAAKPVYSTTIFRRFKE